MDDFKSYSVIPPELRPLVPLDGGGRFANIRFKMIYTNV
jgi:DNA-directed RNA polymerase beta' subunit